MLHMLFNMFHWTTFVPVNGVFCMFLVGVKRLFSWVCYVKGLSGNQ